MVILDENFNPIEPRLEYASFGERLAAHLLDALIITLPSYLLPIIFPWLYNALLESSKSGATVGKSVMGIRVTDMNGERIGFGPATGRFFGKILSVLTFFIGYFLMLFNTRRQTLHDMMAGTIVIRKDTGLPSRPPKTGRSWKAKSGDIETHLVRITEQGGRYVHISPLGERARDFALWQLADGKVDFSPEFGTTAYLEMQQYAEELLKNGEKVN